MVEKDFKKLKDENKEEEYLEEEILQSLSPTDPSAGLL
jgi:hypothetical protein